MAWGEYFLTFWEFLKENTVPLQGLLAILAIVSFAAYRMHWLVSRARIRRKKAKAASPSDALPSLAIVADEVVVQASAAPARAQGSGMEEGKPSVAVSLPEGQTAPPQDAQFTPAESAQTPVPTAESPPPAAEPAAVAPEGERRNVTAAVLILSGLTSLGEGSDPEESEKAILRIREQVQRAVEDNGGLVNQFLRDEVVAIFGIPAAHEDDPVRAVRAARAALDGPNGNPAGKGKLSVKAGIDTGLVLVKPGEEGGGRYAVTGTALTRAAELAAAAKKTQILVSGETQRRIAPYFDLKEGRAKKKGAGDPPFLVIDESAVRTRFEASEWRGLTAFSGREQELVTLRGCLDKALGGQGQFATIMGEAGIGKSRLLHEFRQGLDRDQINVLEGRCQSTGENTPYLPFVNALRRGLRLSDKDSPEALGEKVAANTLAIDSALEPYIPLYLHLLSLHNENYPLAENLKGEDLRAAIGQALGAFITQSALRQPMVFILEDWHWTDEASDAALRFFLGLVASIPLLLIVSLRPEYDRAWPNLSFHAHLVLQPLPDRQGMEIVRSAFGAEQLPEGLGELIYGRTGGNPFFIEEMCSNLLEEGIVQIEGKRAVLAHPADEVILPGTVQAVIRSRLDRLDAESREVLQLASVIGREFDLRLLEHAHTDPSGLSDRLEKLKAQEILRQTRILPEPVYRFNHVLTQEVTYETLLIERRRALHELVGRVIEELYADRLEENYEGLAHHFAHGNVWDKAVKYYLQAGIKARKKFAVASASDHFDHAERIVTERAPKLSWRVMYDLYLEKAQTLGNRGQWRFAYETVQSAVLIAEREG
ncbi:MAG: AAA family ATPase, partial [SAR324 cluster bacterium]|nr:AAA family ATPase [SAR324 cluster bacterium]